MDETLVNGEITPASYTQSAALSFFMSFQEKSEVDDL